VSRRKSATWSEEKRKINKDMGKCDRKENHEQLEKNERVERNILGKTDIRKKMMGKR